MENFKKKYRDLEMRVLCALKKAVNKSNSYSKTHGTEALKVNIYGLTELVIIHDNLTFLDSMGYEHSIFADCSLEDLIDILNENK
jgi:hypothetical protein